MTYKMKGSGFYGKGNQSPAKQKDRLDAMQQQTDINSADADLYHKERAVSMQKDEDRHTRQKNTRSKLGVFSPLKKHEEGHEEEEERVINAENQELSDYLTSDGNKTIRGGVKAARAGIANQSGPKFGGGGGGLLGGILGKK